MAITFNPLGSASASNTVGFDMNILSSYYGSGAALGSKMHAQMIMNGPLGEYIKQKDALDVIPPWLIRPPAGEDTTARDKVFDKGKLIDTKDKAFEDANDTTRNLFAAYKALDRINSLIDYAGTKQGETQITSLMKRFDAWVTELKTFVDKSKFDGLKMMSGIENASIKSTVARKVADPVDLALGLPIDDVYLGHKISSVRADPIPGITGTETFTLSVTKNGVTTDLAADMADAASTKIDDVADYLSGLLSDAGFGTKVQVERNKEDSYSLEIVTVTGETLSFSNPSDPETAVYVVGTTGGGDFQNGLITKDDDLDAVEPNQVFYNNIFTQQSDVGRAVAVDSNGYVYALGTTKGSMDNQVATGVTDIFLNKYDQAGRLVSTRMVGAAKDATGYAMTIDADDNVLIAGQAFGPLTATANSTNPGFGDSFVMKLDSSGKELWTRQVAPYGTDGASSIAVDATGNVYVGGFVRGTIAAGQVSAGGKDGYVTKLSSSGSLVYNQQFGTASDETVGGVVVDGAGGVFVAGLSGTNGYLRKYDDTGGTPTLVYNNDLGDLGADGTVTGIVRTSAGRLYIAGSTTNSSLDAIVTTAHHGDLDGYVLSLQDNGASASAQFVSYTGTLFEDHINGIALDAANGNDVYVTGDTDYVFTGEGDINDNIDAFYSRISANGVLELVQQYSGGTGATTHRGMAIALDNSGSSILSRLGLPTGAMFPTDSQSVVSQTTARAGQYFYLEVNGRTTTRITVQANDLWSSIAARINQALGTSGKAQVKKSGDVESLVITAKNGGDIVIKAGKDGFNALPGLGLRETRLLAPVPDTGDAEEMKRAKAARFALGLADTFDLTTKKGREEAGILFSNALREIKDAYRFSVVGYEEPKKSVGATPPDMAVKIAQYKDALARISALAPQSGGGGLLG